MSQLKNFLQSRPIFFLLLPLFFVFHGFTENFSAIPVFDGLYLLGIYLLAAIILYFLGWLIFRKRLKAALFSFTVMGFHFFFGALHDFMKNIFGNGFLTRYSFLLPFFLVLFIVFLVWLKKKKSPLMKTGFFLNSLLLILVIIDLGWLVQKLTIRRASNTQQVITGSICDSCTRPDIYFLLFDEYSSSSALKELWNYDNSELDTFLAGKGFTIQPYAKSNYNFTQFSISSTLNMEYLEIPDPKACTIKDYNRQFERIKENKVAAFLRSNGYEIVNYSIFDLHRSPSPVAENMLPLKTRLITGQTFLSRLRRDLFYHLLTGRFAVPWLTKDMIYFTARTNKKIINATLEESKQSSPAPRFVYSHIKMPHPPFYFTSQGEQTDKAILSSENAARDPRSYLEYIPKTNEVIRELVNNILNNSKRPVVILLMSDHGFRANQPEQHYFSVQNAVYCSYKKLGGFYPAMSTVNQFRVLFNEIFNQQHPMLKDSSIFLVDK